ncbi:MAG: hypothetical protein J4F40_03635 [Alphaproteobacteria bacterium]|nr:hypothetical protein [Alphaproteobacteria bacterium]MCY4499285.1 hypothetical protein [Rhodospirillaceae bacterium]
MSDGNQNGGEDGSGESPDPRDQSFLSRHGCLITIIVVLLIGAAAGLWGFISWLERGN